MYSILGFKCSYHHLSDCCGYCMCLDIIEFFSSCRHALDIREHYERKLERANNLYMELNAIMLQLEIKEKELLKYENFAACFITLKMNS